LSTRVRHVLVAAGPGPYHEIAPEALDPEDMAALELLADGEVDAAVAVVTAGVRRAFDAMCRLPAIEFAAAFSAGVPPNERYLDTRPGDRATFFADVQRALERYDGFVRDNLSWSGPWDFDLGDVDAPVVLSYGAADSMVTPIHGEWLAARLPQGTLTVHPGATHGEVTFGQSEWLFATLKN
jgi:pimeloyl-ACP methyl ester carboxylesterase